MNSKTFRICKLVILINSDDRSFLHMDVVSRHNQLRDISVQMCQFASVRASIEAGSRLSHKYLHTRPTDAIRQLGLLQTCSPQLHCGLSAWFGSTHMVEVGTTAGSAALSTEIRKHENNDQKCSELSWVCVPIAVKVRRLNIPGHQASCEDISAHVKNTVRHSHQEIKGNGHAKQTI